MHFIFFYDTDIFLLGFKTISFERSIYIIQVVMSIKQIFESVCAVAQSDPSLSVTLHV